jgi:ribonuclease E
MSDSTDQKSDPPTPGDKPTGSASSSSEPASEGSGPGSGSGNRRRRGSRGGRNRSRNRSDDDRSPDDAPAGTAGAEGAGSDGGRSGDDRGSGSSSDRDPEELPERAIEGKPKSKEAAEKALVRRPQIGDSRPAPAAAGGSAPPAEPGQGTKGGRRRRRRGGRYRSGQKPAPIEAITAGSIELDDEVLEQRRGRERKGKPVGRYLMVVGVRESATQIAVLEGRNLIEHYVSKPADDITQIHGNIYLGRVQNVLPGMEAAFVDIGTPKNAVLYKGDVQYDAEDIEQKGSPRIEQMLSAGQNILSQVTKNPIAHKGARLTQEVSLPGRFVVLIPNSTTYGISKRLPDDERKRLRKILDRVRPEGHGIIVRTAAEYITEEEIVADVGRLASQWEQIEKLGKQSGAPALLYREPDMAVRVIREEFNKDYRGIVIDDETLFGEIKDYVSLISPALAERVEHYDRSKEPLSLFERFHVHEQLHKALDKKVWLPSGGSLIIESTEALSVIDVNTGKNVGSRSLEETVFLNNVEAAEEVAKQLRLRDIGGIIVVDFIDMEIRENRDKVMKVFRDALSRDKTRTQVFDISELGLVEMTRKRIGEGLLESFSTTCPECEGRGVLIDEDLLL